MKLEKKDVVYVIAMALVAGVMAIVLPAVKVPEPTAKIGAWGNTLHYTMLKEGRYYILENHTGGEYIDDSGLVVECAEWEWSAISGKPDYVTDSPVSIHWQDYREAYK